MSFQSWDYISSTIIISGGLMQDFPFPNLNLNPWNIGSLWVFYLHPLKTNHRTQKWNKKKIWIFRSFLSPRGLKSADPSIFSFRGLRGLHLQLSGCIPEVIKNGLWKKQNAAPPPQKKNATKLQAICFISNKNLHPNKKEQQQTFSFPIACHPQAIEVHIACGCQPRWQTYMGFRWPKIWA